MNNRCTYINIHLLSIWLLSYLILGYSLPHKCQLHMNMIMRININLKDTYIIFIDLPIAFRCVNNFDYNALSALVDLVVLTLFFFYYLMKFGSIHDNIIFFNFAVRHSLLKISKDSIIKDCHIIPAYIPLAL